MRQIFLDTETTGLQFKDGHRVIEFGAVEMVDRKLTKNNLHFYFKPDIAVSNGAFDVHGLSNEFLDNKPLISEKIDEIMNYLKGTELIIHNASFDVPFLNWELESLKSNKWGKLEDHCQIKDSLVMAREIHPGQKNSLDALCSRYGINNQHRTLHGALLDAKLLSEVYLMMTGGQTDLFTSFDENKYKILHGLDFNSSADETINSMKQKKLIDLHNTDLSNKNHEQYLNLLDKKSNNQTLWRKLMKY